MALKTRTSGFYKRLISKPDTTSCSGVVSWKMKARGLLPCSSELGNWYYRIVSCSSVENRVLEVQNYLMYNNGPLGNGGKAPYPPTGATLFSV